MAGDVPYVMWPPTPPARWASTLRVLAARAKVVLAAPAQVMLDPWLAAVREARLVPGLWTTAAGLTDAQLVAWRGRGPVLVALRPDVDDTPAIWQALRARLASLRDPHLRVALLGVPRCHAGPLTGDVQLALVGPPITGTAVAPNDPRCAACGAQGACPGPMPGHPVVPLPVAISNQLDLVETPTGELSLEDGRRFACHAPDALARLRATGQLYLDVSDKARLDDFAEDLRLLVPLPDGRWRVRPEQPFAAEEHRLRAVLAGLRGVVVDVGAGPIRYLQELRAAMAAGQVRYVAVEPDVEALARTAAALPGAQLVRGVGEALPLVDGSADAVLLLRSVNHLRDLRQGLREAVRVLRPGGTLVLVDNVEFGLLRTPTQLQRAHAVPLSVTPFEHYRNDDATDVAVVLQELRGVRIDIVEAVGPGRSNQWLLTASKHEPRTRPES